MRIRNLTRLALAAAAFLLGPAAASANTEFTFRQPLNLRCGVPGTVNACPIPNGTGQLICDTSGNNGSCTLVSCDATYHAASGACVSDTQSCVPGNGSAGQQGWTGSGWGVCVASACNAGYHVEGGACLPDTRACTVANAAAASQSWTGAGYTACAATACVSGYHVAAGACVADVQGCPVANGTGSQTWAGSGWGTCFVVSCNSGYHAAAGACISNAQSCSIANGAGSQTWTGSAWGACTVTGCDGGYYVSGNGCAAYSYAWQAGGWSGCSASCGGGVQSRSVWCQRGPDGTPVDGSYCGWGAQPSSSQSCNTQSCGPPRPTLSFGLTGAIPGFTYWFQPWSWHDWSWNASNAWVIRYSEVRSDAPGYTCQNYNSTAGSSGTLISTTGGSSRNEWVPGCRHTVCFWAEGPGGSSDSECFFINTGY